MRRLYERGHSHDEDPFTPHERTGEYEPQSFRSLDASAWSDRLLPHSLRRRFVSVRVSTPRTEFERGQEIPFAVTMKNRLPIPVTIRTASPVLWAWSVDGLEEASHVRLRNPPDRTAKLYFGRGETKRFTKRWSQLFRVSDRKWQPAEPGEYTISARINTENEPSNSSGLSDETTIEIVS